MNSNSMVSNFANNSNMSYGVHYATLASDKVSYDNPVGKFIMGFATPNLSSDAYDIKYPKTSTSNVVNTDNLGTVRITSSNYIEISVPMHLFYITDMSIIPNATETSCNPQIKVTRKSYTKGQKFLVVNISGNVDIPCIIGVVD